MLEIYPHIVKKTDGVRNSRFTDESHLAAEIVFNIGEKTDKIIGLEPKINEGAIKPETQVVKNEGAIAIAGNNRKIGVFQLRRKTFVIDVSERLTHAHTKNSFACFVLYILPHMEPVDKKRSGGKLVNKKENGIRPLCGSPFYKSLANMRCR